MTSQMPGTNSLLVSVVLAVILVIHVGHGTYFLENYLILSLISINVVCGKTFLVCFLHFTCTALNLTDI